jgi:SOS-response transcriptional repressor LexA
MKREIYELKMTTQNIKEELNKDMENLRKKNQTQILEIKSPSIQTKNTVEGHCVLVQQTRTSGRQNLRT